MTRFLARLESADADQNGRLVEVDTETTVVGSENRLIGSSYLLGPYSVNFETPDIGVENAEGDEPGVLLEDVTIPAGSLVNAFIHVTEGPAGWDTVSMDAVLQNVAGTAGRNMGGPTSKPLSNAIAEQVNWAETAGSHICMVPCKPAALFTLFSDPGPGGPLTAGAVTIWFEVWEPNA